MKPKWRKHQKVQGEGRLSSTTNASMAHRWRAPVNFKSSPGFRPCDVWLRAPDPGGICPALMVRDGGVGE